MSVGLFGGNDDGDVVVFVVVGVGFVIGYWFVYVKVVDFDVGCWYVGFVEYCGY